MRTIAVALLIAGSLGLAHGGLLASFQIGVDPVPPSWTQRPGQSPTPNVHNPQVTETAEERMEREQRAKLNDKRQAQALTDVARLAQLSKELQGDLERANGASLPANTFKKADEIIKLAKSVKDKMRPL